ncbi:hypothetical protein BBJ28_00016150 [Nothophytophthora sp. Chile5]|nr:hypothetical protein BBJ28_00016150 [Nothophytophthora sp. Chile5]
MSLNEHDAAASGLMGVEDPLPPPPSMVKALGPAQAEVVVKRNQSKYDFVKVRVWVEGDHVYVLSRYLLDAVQISLDLKRLADRLNLSSVLQTDLIFELMCNFSGQEKTSYVTSVFPSKDELISEYQKECKVVRKGVESDIDKCLKDGKSLIIEGFHIDPRLYQKTIAAPEKDSKGNCAGIVVPFLLTLEEDDHRNFMTNSPDPRYRGDQNATGFRNLQDVQSYLVAHSKEDGMLPFTEIHINLHSFHETLDLIHDVVLKRIEEIFLRNQCA